jgi:hypothetical protein
MFLLAVMLIALAMLFLLTALALGAGGQLRHPARIAIATAAAIVIGIALLVEYGSAVE